MRRLAKQTISNRDLQVCRILAVRFTRSIPKLYGKKYVRYNVHLLTHIVDSVQTWGAPWASSAFLYESWGGLLSNFYKGTKSVTKEIFSYFLARKSFRKFSKCHMENASESVKRFYLKLDPAFSDEILAPKCSPLGKIESNALDSDAKTALTDSLGPQICSIVQECKRFQLKHKLYSTFDYSNRFRRDNSVVFVKGGRYYRIFSIFNVCIQCSCISETVCDRGNVWDSSGKKLCF